jgi:hypothetical protein
MRIPPDKLAHLKAGAAVAVVACLAGLALTASGLHPLSALLLVAGFGTGAAVEYAQRDSNARLAAQGQPPLHDVSRADLVASAVPCTLAAAAIELLCHLGRFPL